MHIYTANKKGKIPFDHYYYLYLRPCKFTNENKKNFPYFTGCRMDISKAFKQWKTYPFGKARLIHDFFKETIYKYYN